MSEEIVCRKFCRQGLHAHVKQKKLALSKKNIKTYLEFARKHEF